MQHFLNKKNINLTVLAKNIQDFRKKMGYKRLEMANHIGWSLQQLTAYELGLQEPKVSELIHLARFFNKSPEDIMNEEYSSNLNLNIQNLYTMKQVNTIKQVLPKLVNRTNELEKILAGLRAFHELSTSSPQIAFNIDEQVEHKFSVALELLENHLQLNWELIERLKG